MFVSTVSVCTMGTGGKSRSFRQHTLPEAEDISAFIGTVLTVSSNILLY